MAEAVANVRTTTSTRQATGGPTPAAGRGKRSAARPIMDDQFRFTGAGTKGLTFERRWTTPGVHPYDEVDWELRDATIANESGKAVFEQHGVEVPSFWSQLATNVVVSKYFRGHIGSPGREHSVKQLIDRVVDTIAGWAATQHHFATDEDLATFKAELTHLLLHQKMAFNSPVWFNVGVEPRPQCSACQPFRALVSTPDGMIPIGRLVEQGAVGQEVYDASGVTRIVAVKANGLKPVWRVTLRNGSYIEATPDHVVKAVRAGHAPEWLRLDELGLGMRMHLYPHRAKVSARAVVGARSEGVRASVGTALATIDELDLGHASDPVAVAEAALAGWLQADGFVGQYATGTNRSLTIEFQVASDDEYRWVMEKLDAALPSVHHKVREADTKKTRVRRIRMYGETLRDFVERWGLLARGTSIRVPMKLWTASTDEICAYLRSVFQADGYISVRRTDDQEAARIGLAVISERWTEDIQILLQTIGIYSRRIRKLETRSNRRDLHEVSISIGSERARFAELIGFIGREKQARLMESLSLRDAKRCPDLREEEIVGIDVLGPEEVYDIQTESGEYLSNNVAVHNCFINSVEDSMSSIMDLAKTEAMLFKYGSGAGVNLSPIRGSKERMSGGGIASGPVSFMKGFDAFAGVVKCLIPETYVVTSDGLLRIDEAIPTAGPEGFEESSDLTLNTPAGPAPISHIYRSPLAATRSITLRSGLRLTGTHEHPVLTLTKGFRLTWTKLADIKPGDRVAVERSRELWPGQAPLLTGFDETYSHRNRSLSYPAEVTPALARLLGYLVSAGWIGDDRFSFQSADPEVMADYCRCIEAVFGIDPSSQVSTRTHPRTGVRTAGLSLSWKGALQLLDFCGLPSGRSADKSVPIVIRRSPRSLVLEFIAAYTEGDGHVGPRRIEYASASAALLEQLQLLGLNLGVVARRSSIKGYGRLTVMGEDAARLSRLLRPYLVSSRKRLAAASLAASNTIGRNPNLDVIPGLVAALRSLFTTSNGWVYTAAGEVTRTGFGIFNRTSENISYARVDAIPDLVGRVAHLSEPLATTLSTILEDRYLWDDVTTVGESGERHTYDFTVPGIHAFIANGIVSHNSGGKTRRAAKMVILDADHPDVLDFIDSKANEERKAWALIEAGYDPSFTGEAYGSVFFQNANHSVRVADDFMRAIEDDEDWTTHEVTSGAPAGTYPARSIFRRMAEAAWICGDPGIQYDTTINDWNPVANSDRQYATNPCSEFSFINDSSCNLASLNLMRFVDADGEFDAEAFGYASRLTITAQEIIVDNAAYPTPKIEENSHRFRPLGLGYANLGALLMSLGLAYDSPEGRAYAAAITAIMTGEAYLQSAVIARDHGGPFNDYALNEEPFLRVIAKHRDAAYLIEDRLVPASLIEAARRTWDEALELGRQHGYRNAQVTLLAPTGCLVGGSLVLSDRGLVRLRTLGDADGDRWQALDLAVATDDGPRKATRFFVNGAEPVVHVTTRRGYRISGTTMHRVKVIDAAGDWRWRRLGDLRQGDRVPLMLGGMIGDSRDVALPPLAEAYWTSDHRTRVPRHMSPDLAELVGYFMGDGSLHSRGLRFCVDVRDSDVEERLVELGERLFGLTAVVSQRAGYREVVFDSVRLTLWWEACGFAKRPPHAEHSGKGYRAHIPDSVLYTNDPDVYRAFVRGLFEADGNTSHGYASWSTVDGAFADDVQVLLLALGFVTTRKVDRPVRGHLGRNPVHVLRLLNQRAGGSFVRSIGFISERKRNSLQLAEYRQAARYDLVPVSRETIDRLAPQNDDLRRTMLLSLSRTGLVSRRSATALLERTADPDLAQSLGYFYDEIAGTQLAAEELTYDLSVPSNVTYVANGFVSHNTISFMMDCDTTGIEPDIALIKYKKLVGEGFLKIVNGTVPAALRRLGYAPDEVEAIVAHIDERETIEGAPGLKADHLPVFDCAFKPVNGERSIHHMGHLRMMSAAQPFLSGAISKTVNMPESATAEDIEDVYRQGWRLGLKAIAIYRDGSKRSQPLSTGKKKSTDEHAPIPTAGVASEPGLTGEPKPYRRRLPDERRAVTHKFQVAGHEGYITVGLYPDGAPGEIFLKMAKEGSTVSGLMDTLATMTSIALQYGVPLRDLVSKFAHVRFEPSGFTGNPEVPIAKSTVDYIFRWMGSRFLSKDDRDALGILGGAIVAEAPVEAITPQGTFEPAEEAPDSTVAAPPPAPSPSSGGEGGARPTALATIEAADPAPTPGVALMANGANGTSPRANGTGPLSAGLGARQRIAFAVSADSPSCMDCGSIMVRSGSCYKCLNCGSTSGCS